MAPLPSKASQAGAGVGGVPCDAVLNTLPPIQAGPQCEADRGCGDRRWPRISLHPGTAHPPPSSHTSARGCPCTHPAPQSTQGAHGGCLPHSRVGFTPHGLPWDMMGSFNSSHGRGKGCTGSAPQAGGTWTCPFLSHRAEGKGYGRAHLQQTHW